MRKYKYIIVWDTDDKWYVRRVKTTIEQYDMETMAAGPPLHNMVYKCDKPIGGAQPSLLAAIGVLNRATQRTKRKR